MAEKNDFKEKSEPLIKTINELKQQEKFIEKSMLSKSEEEVLKLKIHLQDVCLNISSHNIVLTELQYKLTGAKNDTNINDSRKYVYKAVSIWEELLTSFLDAPFSDYEDKLDKLSWMSDDFKYRVVLKLGFSIDSLIFAFGENSRFKWSLLELSAKHAIICKNIINFKRFIADNDPRVAGYEVRNNLVNLCKKLLEDSANMYRQKYELATQTIGDISLSIKYLSALKYVYICVGDSANAEEIKKKITIWKAKMDEDMRIMEEKSKKFK